MLKQKRKISQRNSKKSYILKFRISKISKRNIVRNLYSVSLLLLSLAAIYGCEPESITKVPKEAEGYKPIYADPATVKEVK